MRATHKNLGEFKESQQKRKEQWQEEVPLLVQEDIGNEQTFRTPMNSNFLVDCEALEYLIQGVYSELSLSPLESPVIFLTSTLMPLENKAKIMEIMFEKLGVPALYTESSALMSLLSQNVNTGLVVESGDSGTLVVPIINCVPIESACKMYPIAGNHITQQMLRTLLEKPVNEGITLPMARSLKHQYANLSQCDIGNHCKIGYIQQGGYTRNVELGRDSLRCAEQLFQSVQCVQDQASPQGLQHIILDAVTRATKTHETRQTLFHNVLPCGGNTQLQGFDERLVKELNNLGAQAKVIQSNGENQRSNMATRGGMIFSLLPQVRDQYFTKQMYEEVGTQYPISIE